MCGALKPSGRTSVVAYEHHGRPSWRLVAVTYEVIEEGTNETSGVPPPPAAAAAAASSSSAAAPLPTDLRMQVGHVLPLIRAGALWDVLSRSMLAASAASAPGGDGDAGLPRTLTRDALLRDSRAARAALVEGCTAKGGAAVPRWEIGYSGDQALDGAAVPGLAEDCSAIADELEAEAEELRQVADAVVESEMEATDEKARVTPDSV